MDPLRADPAPAGIPPARTARSRGKG